MDERKYEQFCLSATNAAEILQGKWRVPILCSMHSGPVRLGRLRRLLPSASKKVLVENLRQLQGAGVLVRTDLSESLLHVEYDYSEDVRIQMMAVLMSLNSVGELRQQHSSRQ